MIGIVSYGVGNLFSLTCSIKKVGGEVVVSSDEKVLSACDKIVLPGVGAFGEAVDKLRASGLDKLVLDSAQKGKPVLGICLGMQLLFEKSYEFGEHKGLGLIKGEILPFQEAFKSKNIDLKIPQIGWNSLDFCKEHYLTSNVKEGDFVYYVHSFYAPKGDYTVASSDYGVTVTGIAENGCVSGCQFHPEKSGEVGLNILRAFVQK